MKAKFAIAAAALALALVGCSKGGANGGGAAANGPLPQIPAPNGDWTQVVSETPQGGFRMGNPNAPVKLVEYASLSCPFCARFDLEGVPTLRDKYVKSGEVSWEYRTYLNHPTDPAVAALAHCRGADSFFALADQLYATQEQWFDKLVNYPKDQYAQLDKLTTMEKNAAIAHITGLDDIFRQHGMPSSKIDACLKDQSVLNKLQSIVDLGNKDGITGTPNFLINGKLEPEAGDWKTLEPILRAAIR